MQKTTYSADFPNIKHEPRFKTNVEGRKIVAPDVLLLTLKRPGNFEFKAGQYIWLVLPERSKHEGIVDRRAYSIYSATSSTKIELLIRLTENDYLNDVKNLKKNDPIEIIGPMGSAFIPTDEGAVMISGGVGAAPFISIFRSSPKGNYSLFSFESTGRPIHCKQELEELSRAHGYRYQNFYEAPSIKTFENLLKEFGNRPIFVAGPQEFVNTVSEILLALGIPRHRLHFEACYPQSPGHAYLHKIFERINDAGEIEKKMVSGHEVQNLVEKNKIMMKEDKDLMTRIINWSLVIGIATAIASGLFIVFAEGHSALAQIIFFTMLVGASIWRYFGASDQAIGHVILVAAFIGLIIPRFDLELGEAMHSWVLVFPVITYKFVSPRAAKWWDSIFILIFIGLSLAGNYGLWGIPSFEDSLPQYVLALTFISLMTILFSEKEAARKAIIDDYFLNQQIILSSVDEIFNLSEMFVKIASQTSNHVVLTDRDGNILYANRAAEHMTGYIFREMKNQTPRLWGGLMPSEKYRKLWKKKSSGKIVNCQILNRRRDGQLYFTLARMTPITSGKEIVAYVSTEEDISSIVNIDKAKSEFTSLVSHQLRTPLTAIGWYSEMLLAGNAGKLDEKKAEYVKCIHNSNQRMSRLLSALLNVTRIEMGTFEVDLKSINLNELTMSVIDEQKPQISNKRIKIDCSVQENIPEISADNNLLRMVFQNLLSNAIKYNKPGGEVSMEISYQTEVKTVTIKVADSGIGIPKEEENKIFLKLYRASNAMKMENDGTGLGLYIVKSVVEDMGGSIRFESKINKGTTFFVTLPVSAVAKK